MSDNEVFQAPRWYSQDEVNKIREEYTANITRLGNEIERLRKALEAAYTAGFEASSEGWNGEHGCDTEADADFLHGRNAYVRAIINGGTR